MRTYVRTYVHTYVRTYARTYVRTYVVCFLLLFGGASSVASVVRTYVRILPRQEHHENHRDWLSRFVAQEWGRSIDAKEVSRLKGLCSRCRQIFLAQEKIRGELAIGPGRGRQGFRVSRTLLNHRKRVKGGGAKIKCPELGYELYQWTVDTIQNLKQRLFGWMLTEQARIIAVDIEKYCEDEGLPCKLPVIGAGFLHRWRLEWGLTRRAVSVVYKVAWKDVVIRVGVGLRNNIRVRALWERLFPDVPFRVMTFDQKPMWFNSNGCSDIRIRTYISRYVRTYVRTKSLGSGDWGLGVYIYVCVCVGVRLHGQ